MNILDQINSGTKAAGDALSITVVVGTISQMLPSIAALLTIIWTALRIYETRTVGRWIGRRQEGRRGED